MRTLFHSFLMLIAKATDRELARYLEFLKFENRILRAKLPRRLEVTPRERQRLIKYGKPLGTAIQDLITIVTLRTFARWLQQERGPSQIKPRKSGRPATPADIQELIVRMGREKLVGLHAYSWRTEETRNPRIAFNGHQDSEDERSGAWAQTRPRELG
jgi:putative transposase